MFNSLSDRLTRTLQNLRGQGRLTESNIKEAMREIRVALLEADVALPVVKSFLDDVEQASLGQDVSAQLNPGQVLVKIVHDSLITTLGGENTALNFATQPPAVFLMAGLQGSGKTTTTAKLARLIEQQDKKSVLLVSTDVYRPAAIDQLAVLAKEIGVDFFPSSPNQSPLDIAKNALQHAKQKFKDVLIIDTAGRLHIDDEMMTEIKALHAAVNPIETLFVVDSMTGQDAANTAKAFNDALPLTGVILTKTDGDARGGAALSIRNITGKPIKFIGVGEKIDALEVFHPERIASRILGMGDILTLVEEAERKIDKEKSKKLARKLQRGHEFDLVDFRDQIAQINNMGGMMGMLGKIPGLSNLTEQAKSKVNDSQFTQLLAIINSMTEHERRFPKVIGGSRKKRIAKGSGTQIQDVNRLLKQFTQMQKMMKKMSKPGAMKNLMRGMGNLGGLGGGGFGGMGGFGG